MGKLLAKLVAPRACRAVKFSRSAIDLLCYTECAPQPASVAHAFFGEAMTS